MKARSIERAFTFVVNVRVPYEAFAGAGDIGICGAPPNMGSPWSCATFDRPPSQLRHSLVTASFATRL